jgi:hypothetical protein
MPHTHGPARGGAATVTARFEKKSAHSDLERIRLSRGSKPITNESRLVPFISTSSEPMVTTRLGQMVTLSPRCRRLAEQPLRLSHNKENLSQAQGPSSHSQAERAEDRPWQPSAAAGTGQPSAPAAMAAERCRWLPSSADGGRAP